MAKKTSTSAQAAIEQFEKAVQDMVVASDELYRVALAISDGYWEAISGEADNLGAFFRYGVRVKRRIYGVSIEWMAGIPVVAGDARKMLFRSIPRGGGATYRRSTFDRAKPWEIAEIMKAEAQFAKVRNASDGLAGAGLRMRWLKKVLERGGEVDSKRLRTVLKRAEDACGAVSELALG